MQFIFQKNLNLQSVCRLLSIRVQPFSSETTRVRNLNSLKHELKNNPNFDRSFPQFKGKKPETTVNRKKEELDFIRSLGLKDRLNRKITIEEADHQNFKQFVEGYKSPNGPLRYMEEDEKKKVKQIMKQN